jgi:hypothetical protein
LQQIDNGRSISENDGGGGSIDGRSRARRPASADVPNERKRPSKAETDREMSHHRPAHLQVAGKAHGVRRVEHQIGLSAKLLERPKRQPREDASTLIVGVGGGVDGPHRLDAPVSGLKAPPKEGTKSDDAAIGFGHHQKGTPKRILQVLPPEKGRGPDPGRPTSEGRVEERQHGGLVCVAIRADGQLRRRLHRTTSVGWRCPPSFR